MKFLLETDINWTATGVVVAFLFVVGGALWGAMVMYTRGKLEKIRVEVEKAIVGTTAEISAARVEVESLKRRIEQLDGTLAAQPLSSLRVGWGSFVETVADSVTLLSARLDWHSASLARLSHSGGWLSHPKAAATSDAKLRDGLDPCLFELDLFHPEAGRREAAARSLAEGTGGVESLAKMESLTPVCPEFEVWKRRLVKRLSESGESGARRGW